MKTLKILCIVALFGFGLTSCKSTHVTTDYDRTVDFDQYQTFAFYKPGIDQAKISDLDKRRILRAIDTALTKRGMTKSKDADLLIGIDTDEATNIDVHENYYGWYNPWYYPYYGVGPWYYGRYYSPYRNNYSRSTSGTLYIDLIDGKEKSLIWQGRWEGTIKPNGTVEEKTSLIHDIVNQIIDHYPPGHEPEGKK